MKSMKPQTKVVVATITTALVGVLAQTYGPDTPWVQLVTAAAAGFLAWLVPNRETPPVTGTMPATGGVTTTTGGPGINHPPLQTGPWPAARPGDE